MVQVLHFKSVSFSLEGKGQGGGKGEKGFLANSVLFPSPL
jgi:hypothetical protein